MFVIGITGGIGCGKSTVATICREAGLPVVDADAISREVTAAGGLAIPAITAAFGTGVIDEKGGLDRTAMARKVFQNRGALDNLSRIVHQHVVEQMKARVEALAGQKQKAAVLDVPIPVKNGFLDICDQVWVVWAADENRLSRLRGRGMGEDEARRRMDMQMTKEEYLDLADHFIENNQDIASLADKVRELLERELGSRGIRIRGGSQP